VVVVSGSAGGIFWGGEGLSGAEKKRKREQPPLRLEWRELFCLGGRMIIAVVVVRCRPPCVGLGLDRREGCLGIGMGQKISWGEGSCLHPEADDD